MRQKLFIFIGIFLLLLVLAGLNAVSYTRKEKPRENEFEPNRSSYNAGATGTKAFYDLLAESDRKVVRWQEPPDALLANKNAPKTFVVIGSVRREFTDVEIRNLLQWAAKGGKLVVIDREPPPELIKTTADWNVSFEPAESMKLFGIEPTDQTQTIAQVDAVKPVQPTVYTQKINAVQPSIFASSIKFDALTEEESSKRRQTNYGIGAVRSNEPPPPPPPAVKSDPTPNYAVSNNSNNKNISGEDAKREIEKSKKSDKPVIVNSPKDVLTGTVTTDEDYPPAFTAPVVHLGTSQNNLLVDVPYYSGEIVFLSDPFIVSNDGINLVDNAQLGINIVSTGDGAIAFDEYHQGFGANRNRLFEYFAGTPVVAIFLQAALLVALLFFSQSRRFARAVSEPEPDRLSKLEYVSAMAQLQQRTKAFDLAIENIYTDFRRRASKLVGAGNYNTPHGELARLISERIKIDRGELEELMRKCEDIMHGEPTNKKEVVALSSRLREIENLLGMRRGTKQL